MIMEQNNVTLRKATDEENEILKAWAEKEAGKIRKFMLILLAGFLAVYLFLLIVNALYVRSLLITASVIFLLVFLLGFFSAVFFGLAAILPKKIRSGAYKVQSGKITDRNEDGNSKDSSDCIVVFESDDGISAKININPALYKTVKTGPCLILKWDDPKNNKYYRVINLNS